MIHALLGGSFDPVHAGHVAMAAHVLRHGLADHVVVVPNWQSPWREPPAASPADRLAMCRLAFADQPRTSVDGREVAGGRPAFTVDTLTALAAEHPGVGWRLLIGRDHLAVFDRWREPQRILAMATLVVLERAGSDGAPAPAGIPADRLVMAPPFDHPVSSSAIRAMLAAGENPGAMLPPAVAGYVVAHRLYRAP